MGRDDNRGMDAAGLTDKVRVEGANHDPCMLGTFLVKADEVFPVQG